MADLLPSSGGHCLNEPAEELEELPNRKTQQADTVQRSLELSEHLQSWPELD